MCALKKTMADRDASEAADPLAGTRNVRAADVSPASIQDNRTQIAVQLRFRSESDFAAPDNNGADRFKDVDVDLDLGDDSDDAQMPEGDGTRRSAPWSDASLSPGEWRRRHRRTARVPPYMVASCVLGCLPLLVALSIFVPWFATEIAPDYAAESRMVAAECLVRGHTIVETRVAAGNTMLFFLPGLDVLLRFPALRDRVKRRKSIKGHAMPDGCEKEQDNKSENARDDICTLAAVAMPSLDRGRSWMSAQVMDDYFGRHPINSTTRCHYDGADPAHCVVLVPTIENLGQRLVVCMTTTLGAYILVAGALIVVAGPHLCL